MSNTELCCSFSQYRHFEEALVALNISSQGKSYRLEEDDPAKFHETVRALTTKLFADLGRNG